MEPIDPSPYLRLIQKTGSTRHPRGLLATDQLLTRTHLRKTSHVLDVGCGIGYTSAHIAKHYGCLVTGVDISPEVLEKAKALYKNEPFFSSLNFLVANALKLPFPDHSFDVVLCESVLIFVNNKKDAIDEMTRVLKPGGYLALNEVVLKEVGLDTIKEYFRRPQFEGFIVSAVELIELLDDDYTLKLQDEEPLDIKAHIASEIKDLLSIKGLLTFFEMSFQSLVDKESRADLIEVLTFAFELPKGTVKNLRSLLLLAQKNPDSSKP